MAAVVLAAAVGCAAPNRVVLLQPTAPPGQQRLTLATRDAFFDSAGQGVRALLAYPLPGSLDGPRDFLVYLDFPILAGHADVASPQQSGVRGFLIQRKGFRRGKTVFAAGYATLRRRFLDSRTLDLRIEFDCDDQTRITGRVALRLDPRELGEFEARYGADIAALRASQPTSMPQSSPAEGQLATPPSASIIATP